MKKASLRYLSQAEQQIEVLAQHNPAILMEIFYWKFTIKYITDTGHS
jgi:hypothetical protein